MDFDLPNLIKLLPDSFYSEFVTILFSPEGGAPINTILLVLNGGILLAAIAYGIFNFGLYPFSLMTRSKQGGKGNVLAFTRSAVVLLLLFPSPQNGITLWQQVTITVGAAGSNLAQRGWTSIRTSLFDGRQPTYNNPAANPDYVIDRLIELQTCLFYSFIDERRRDFSSGFIIEDRTNAPIQPLEDNNLSRILYFDSAGTAWNDYKRQKGFCGTMRFPDIPTSISEEFVSLAPFGKTYQDAMYQSYLILLTELSEHILQFAYANHPQTFRTAAFPSTIAPDAFRALIQKSKNEFEERQQRIFNLFVEKVQRARLDAFQLTEENWVGEWIQAGGYYNRIAKFANFQHNIASNSAPTFTAPLWDRIFPKPPHHVLAMRTKLSSLISSEFQDLGTNYSSPQFGKDFGPAGGGFIEEKLIGKLRKEIAERTSTKTDFSDPMSALTAKGYTYLSIYAGIFAIVGTLAAFAPPIGLLAWEMTGWLRGLLLFAGMLLAFVIPLVPYVFFVFGIVSWLLPLLFFFFTGGLWLLPNIKSDGNVLIVGNGWTTLLEVFLRPTLLLIGLSAAYGFFTVMVLMLEKTLGTATIYSFDTVEGLIVYAFLQALFGLIMGLAAIGSFSLIVLIPNSLTQYLPQESSINA